MLSNHYAPRAGLGAPARVKTGSQAPINGQGAGDPCQDFRGAILAALGHAPDVIEPCRLHRFATNGRRGDAAGWCRLFDDLRGGVFGCHRQGLQQTWHVADQAGMPWLQRADLQRQVKHLAAKRAAQQGRQWAANAARLAAIWAECIPLTPGDPAALYLQRRGLGDVWPVPAVLRLHRALAYWHGPERLGTFAAMVAPIVAPDGRTVALHRTYLTGDGRKADVPSPKKLTATAGPLAGACIPLHQPAHGCIGMAEGIETALAAWRASSVPTVASYCAGNLAAWEWPAQARRLVIFADADEAGRDAARTLRARAAAAGLRCEVLTPSRPGGRLVRRVGRERRGTGQRGGRSMSATTDDLARLQAAGAVREDAPLPLPAELPPVEPFPMAALPQACAPWVRDVTERMHCPPDFVAVPLLVAAASLVARRVGIRPQQNTDWTERGNLWALIVGRPGIMKSPAMAQALAPMDRLEARAAEEFNARAAQYEAEAMAAKLRTENGIKAARKALAKDEGADVTALLAVTDERDAPSRLRYIVNDLTYEKLGDILATNPDGVLSVRDEMRGLLLSLAREENAPARAFYLQAWSGGRYTFDRIGRGTVAIDDARLSIIGGIQPGPLSDLVQQARRGAADDGMIERFLVAWPDAPGEWREVDRLPDTKAKRCASDTFERLDLLTPERLGAIRELDSDGNARGLPFVRFADDAREAFGQWRIDFERTIRAAEGEGLEGALSKFRHHVPALALAVHVIDGGAGPVGLQATLRALALAEYFESHARRLHSSARRVTLCGARKILDKVRAGALPVPFTLRDVYRNQWAGLSDRAAVADALDLLTAHLWLHETSIETGGRPSTVYSLAEGARHG